MTTNAIEVMNLIDKTDKVLLRCLENGVEFPSEWKAHRAALRAIIKAGVGEPPATPPYPAGS